jgi:hypothetical protein
MHVEGVVRYFRRKALKQRAKRDSRTKVAACTGLRRTRHHADRVADHQPGFADALAVQREARSIPL